MLFSKECVRIIEHVKNERLAQIKKWGEQDHPDLAPVLYNRQAVAHRLGIPTATRAKDLCEEDKRQGVTNWGSILVEEVAEAIEAAALGDTAALEKELIQVAAVCVAQIEAIRRRK